MDTIKGFTAWPHPPPQVWLILLGHLSSQSHLVPGGRRKIRSLQFQLANQWDRRRSSSNHPVPTSQEVLEDLDLVVIRLCESAPGPALGDPEPGHVAVHGRFIRRLGSVRSGRRGEWRLVTSGTLNATPHHFSWVPDKSSYRKTSNGNYP